MGIRFPVVMACQSICPRRPQSSRMVNRIEMLRHLFIPSLRYRSKSADEVKEINRFESRRTPNFFSYVFVLYEAHCYFFLDNVLVFSDE